jgi:hypothetical protein
MTGVMSRTLVVLSLLLVLLVPAPAGAQRSEGLALYRQGTEHYEAGRYREAIDHFKRSLAIYTHKNTFYALGEAYRRLGQLRNSHHYYRRYASMLPDHEREAFEKKIERMLGEARSDLSITTDPPGATVTVNGEIRGSTPPTGALKLTLRAGSYSIGARLAGYRPASRGVTAQFGEPLELHLRLKPAARKQPSRAPAPSRTKIRGFAGLLAGVAATDFADDSLDVYPAFVLDLEGGVMFFRRGRLGLTGIASLSYSGIRDDVVDDSAAFINLVFNIGGRVYLGSRFWFELRFGLGPSILVGAEPYNFLLQWVHDQQTYTGLVARPALCAFWRIRHGVTLMLRLFTLDYSPRFGGFSKLAPGITSIKRYTFGLGLGWHS